MRADLVHVLVEQDGAFEGGVDCRMTQFDAQKDAPDDEADGLDRHAMHHTNFGRPITDSSTVVVYSMT